VIGASERPAAGRGEVRLYWLDGTKGIAILWIVFFHFFVAYEGGRLPWLLDPDYFARYERICAPESAASRALCLGSAVLTAAVQLGFNGVAVFLVLSGFGLSYSLARTDRPAVPWPRWYRSRLIRLLPMYWVAHLVYLVSPFQARLDPLDYRFVLSILGDRVVPIGTIFYYFNPALWYFGLLLQLYLVYPLLFLALQRLGVPRFLLLAAVVTFGARWALVLAVPVNGEWVQGGFFACRLWEFALGMAAGTLWRRRPAAIDAAVLSRRGFLAGGVLYALGLCSYGALWSYVFTDALIGTGLTVVLAGVARAIGRLPWVGAAAIAVGASSYGLYLVHQPYVLYFGARMRSLDTAAFLVGAGPIIAILVLGAMMLERGVNALTTRALD
jgi:peptidoglycan/LPS O-acetylase OafA/YrhL